MPTVAEHCAAIEGLAVELVNPTQAEIDARDRAVRGYLQRVQLEYVGRIALGDASAAAELPRIWACARNAQGPDVVDFGLPYTGPAEVCANWTPEALAALSPEHRAILVAQCGFPTAPSLAAVRRDLDLDPRPVSARAPTAAPAAGDASTEPPASGSDLTPVLLGGAVVLGVVGLVAAGLILLVTR